MPSLSSRLPGNRPESVMCFCSDRQWQTNSYLISVQRTLRVAMCWSLHRCPRDQTYKILPSVHLKEVVALLQRHFLQLLQGWPHFLLLQPLAPLTAPPRRIVQPPFSGQPAHSPLQIKICGTTWCMPAQGGSTESKCESFRKSQHSKTHSGILITDAKKLSSTM